MTSARALVTITSVASATVAAAVACGNDDGSTQADSGIDASVDAPRSTYDASFADADSGPTPEDPFAGWVPFTGYPGCSSLRIPPSVSALPKPAAWEACPPKSPAGCRRMVLDWTPDGSPSPFPSTWMTLVIQRVGSRGDAVTLMTNRWYAGGRTMQMISDVDGAVHFAIASNLNDCFMHAASSDGDAFVYSVGEKDATGGESGWTGAIGGRIGELLPTYVERHPPPTDHRSYVAGRSGIADDVGNLHRWNDAGARTDLPHAIKLARGDAFFSISEESVYVFSEDAGASELLRFDDGGLTRAGGEVGTDEADLVWLEADRAPVIPGPAYENVVAYTSPFATTAGGIQRRALRSDIGGYGFGGDLEHFAVGCGYAARRGARKPDDGGMEVAGLTIIRLADGAAWFIPERTTDDIFNYQPFAMSCTEVFSMVQERSEAGRINMVRIEVASLGAPTPP